MEGEEPPAPRPAAEVNAEDEAGPIAAAAAAAAAAEAADAARIAAGVNDIDLRSQVVKCPNCPKVFYGEHAFVTVLGHAQIFHPLAGGAAAAPVRTGGGSGPKRPNLAAPRVSDQCSPAAWEDFVRKWHAYVRTSSITADVASAFFLGCLDEGVQNTLYRQAGDPNDWPIDDLIAAARVVSVLHIPTGQRRFEALQLRQSDGEKFTAFFTRLRAASLDCKFEVVPPNSTVPVDFSSKIIAMCLLQGLADEDIRRDILKKKDVDSWGPQRIVEEVESRSKASERARYRRANFPRGRRQRLQLQAILERPAEAFVGVRQRAAAHGHAAEYQIAHVRLRGQVQGLCQNEALSKVEQHAVHGVQGLLCSPEGQRRRKEAQAALRRPQRIRERLGRERAGVDRLQRERE